MQLEHERKQRRVVWTYRLLSLCLIVAALSTTSCSTEPARPNIVVIVLDTVRRDFTGSGRSEGAHPSMTPEMDRLAAEGTNFTNAWANAPWTVPSHASMFTGLLPSAHGCPARQPRLVTEEPTFAEILSFVGYETVAFFSNPFLTDELTGMMRGFETSRVTGDPRTLSVLRTSDQGGEDAVRNASEWLAGRSSDRPFLVFVNILEPHVPYDPPGDYRTTHLPDLPLDDIVTSDWEFEFHAGLHPPEGVEWERVRRLHAGDVHYADRLLGDILRLLKEHGVYDDTAIIVTSDHGENLGEHDLFGHRFSIHETLLAVPLVVRAPGMLESGVRDDPVALTDVFATVLELAGIERDELPPHSRSLLAGPSGAPRPLIAEYEGGIREVLAHLREINPGLDTAPFETAYATVRLGDMRLTISSDRSKVLHNVTLDPGQRRDLSGEDPETVNILNGMLVDVARRPDQNIEIDEGMREWLRSLGYMR